MKYCDEIKDEIKGAKHYEALSQKDKKNSKTFKSMAKDERNHKGHLEHMTAKEKALQAKR